MTVLRRVNEFLQTAKQLEGNKDRVGAEMAALQNEIATLRRELDQERHWKTQAEASKRNLEVEVAQLKLKEETAGKERQDDSEKRLLEAELNSLKEKLNTQYDNMKRGAEEVVARMVWVNNLIKQIGSTQRAKTTRGTPEIAKRISRVESTSATIGIKKQRSRSGSSRAENLVERSCEPHQCRSFHRSSSTAEVCSTTPTNEGISPPREKDIEILCCNRSSNSLKGPPSTPPKTIPSTPPTSRKENSNVGREALLAAISNPDNNKMLKHVSIQLKDPKTTDENTMLNILARALIERRANIKDEVHQSNSRMIVAITVLNVGHLGLR